MPSRPGDAARAAPSIHRVTTEVSRHDGCDICAAHATDAVTGCRSVSGRASGHRLRRMTAFVFRLHAPRPTFAVDMTDEEREIMERHAAYWQPFIESGQMVIFGPVLDDTGSWGLGVVETDDEDELRAFAAEDPAVTGGTGQLEIGKLLAGFVRPR